jgi:hypothetical protein
MQVEPLNRGSESFQTEVALRRMPGLSLYTASRSAAIYRRSREFIAHDDVVLINILLPATSHPGAKKIRRSRSSLTQLSRQSKTDDHVIRIKERTKSCLTSKNVF